MALERTLSIVKPDVITRSQTGRVITCIEDAGLRIIAQKRVHPVLEEWQRFYEEHRAKDFFDRLCTFMASAPVVVQVLEGDDVISRYRRLMGDSTDPKDWPPGSIRSMFADASSPERNAVHGSKSSDAEREIAFFFEQYEIVG